MNHRILRIIHPLAGSIALITILTFWVTTVWSKIDGDPAFILNVKTGILYGMIVLIPSMIAVGGSGFKMSKKSKHDLILKKKQRMPFIAINGTLILIPCAVFLCLMAQEGTFNQTYNIVQGIEIIAGAANIILLGLNTRDGLKLTKKIRRD